jgi:hypothetical protein
MLLRGKNMKGAELPGLFTMEMKDEGLTPCWPMLLIMNNGKTNPVPTGSRSRRSGPSTPGRRLTISRRRCRAGMLQLERSWKRSGRSLSRLAEAMKFFGFCWCLLFSIIIKVVSMKKGNTRYPRINLIQQSVVNSVDCPRIASVTTGKSEFRLLGIAITQRIFER